MNKSKIEQYLFELQRSPYELQKVSDNCHKEDVSDGVNDIFNELNSSSKKRISKTIMKLYFSGYTTVNSFVFDNEDDAVHFQEWLDDNSHVDTKHYSDYVAIRNNSIRINNRIIFYNDTIRISKSFWCPVQGKKGVYLYLCE